jgi:hypothetical protein
MALPNAEEALRVINSEVVPGLHHPFFPFATRGKLPILRDFFQYANEPNVTWTYVWRIKWLRNSEQMMLLEFSFDLSSIMEH